MINKKLILIIVIFSLVLFGFGCKKRPGIGPEAVEYHTGTKGLEISAIKNLPPQEIWKGNTFIVGIEIRNSGAYDIEEGRLAISGFDPEYISILEPQTTFGLKGKQPGYPEGEVQLLNFKVQNTEIRKGSEELVSSFTVNAQYHYETKASTHMCIDPDIYNLIKTKVCEIATVNLREGQGAPVAITSIDETISPNGLDYDISFLIHVSNKGNGFVMNKKIKVKEAKLSNQEVKCMEDIYFKEKEDNLIECSITLREVRGAYLAPFTITLEYDYETSVDKKFKVVDLLVKAKKI
jgi:hypothetical protein